MSSRTVFLVAGILVLIIAGGVLYLERVSNIYRYAGTRATLVDIGQALREYRANRGPFPARLQIRDLGGDFPERDAWENPLLLQVTSDSFTITSLGRDGVKGGAGFAQDLIASWERGQMETKIDSADYSP